MGQRSKAASTTVGSCAALLTILITLGVTACAGVQTRGPAASPAAAGVEPAPSPTQMSTKPHVPLKGYTGTFHVKDIAGSTFDITYTYAPKAIAAKQSYLEYSELQISADYSAKITNTTPGRTLSYRSSSPLTSEAFILYAWWKAPSAFCDPQHGQTSPEQWCALWLSFAPIDQDIAPGASLDLVAHAGLWGPPADPGMSEKSSRSEQYGEGLAQPDDFSISFQGDQAWMFASSCMGAPTPSAGNLRESSSQVTIGSQSGICSRGMMLMNVGTTGVIGRDPGYLVVE